MAFLSNCTLKQATGWSIEQLSSLSQRMKGFEYTSNGSLAVSCGSCSKQEKGKIQT